MFPKATPQAVMDSSMEAKLASLFKLVVKEVKAKKKSKHPSPLSYPQRVKPYIFA